MKKLIEFGRDSLRDQPYHKMAAIGAAVLIGLVITDPALAQAANGSIDGCQLFATPTKAAAGIAGGMAKLAMAFGAVGAICCLLLGMFGKLNWKWVLSIGGSSFGIAMVGFIMNQFYAMGQATGGSTSGAVSIANCSL